MAKPVNSLPPWAQAGNYPASVYPLVLPWGDANPVGGAPTPWSNQPRNNAAGLIAFANAGLTPQIPTPADSFNAWLSLAQEYAAWVEAGAATNDADAHLVESDAFGVVTAVAFESEFAFQGLGATKAPLPNGAVIDVGMELELAGSAKIASTSAGIVEAGRFELITGPPAPLVRQMAVNASDQLTYNDGNGKFVHTSLNGYVYATGDQEAATGLAAAHLIATTTVRVAPQTNNVRVIAEGWGQTTGASVNIAVQNDDGLGVFAQIGAFQVSTWVGVGDPNLWSYFRIERVFFAAAAINRLYRCHVVGNGGLADVRELNLRVVPERG